MKLLTKIKENVLNLFNPKKEAQLISNEDGFFINIYDRKVGYIKHKLDIKRIINKNNGFINNSFYRLSTDTNASCKYIQIITFRDGRVFLRSSTTFEETDNDFRGNVVSIDRDKYYLEFLDLFKAVTTYRNTRVTDIYVENNDIDICTKINEAEDEEPIIDQITFTGKSDSLVKEHLQAKGLISHISELRMIDLHIDSAYQNGLVIESKFDKINIYNDGLDVNIIKPFSEPEYPEHTYYIAGYNNKTKSIDINPVLEDFIAKPYGYIYINHIELKQIESYMNFFCPNLKYIKYKGIDINLVKPLMLV